MCRDIKSREDGDPFHGSGYRPLAIRRKLHQKALVNAAQVADATPKVAPARLLQDVLAFEDSIKPGGVADVAKWEKWEKWEADLTVSFEESAADETKMHDHMAALTQIVDSRIDAGTITNDSSGPASNSEPR